MNKSQRIIILIESWVEMKKAENITKMTLEIAEYLDDLVAYIKRMDRKLNKQRGKR